MHRHVARWFQDANGVFCGRVVLGYQTTATSDGPTWEEGKRRMQEAVALSLDVDESEVELLHVMGEEPDTS